MGPATLGNGQSRLIVICLVKNSLPIQNTDPEPINLFGGHNYDVIGKIVKPVVFFKNNLF